MNDKPPCADFIIKVVRTIRYRGPNVKSGVASGVMLRRIYLYAKEAYSAEEFRAGIESLIKDERAVVTALTEEVEKKNNGEHEDHHDTRNIRVMVIPQDLKGWGAWCVNDKGEIIDPAKETHFKRFFQIRLYVKEDGVPDKVKRLIGDKGKRAGVNAHSIIASMRKEE